MTGMQVSNVKNVTIAKAYFKWAWQFSEHVTSDIEGVGIELGKLEIP